MSPRLLIAARYNLYAPLVSFFVASHSTSDKEPTVDWSLHESEARGKGPWHLDGVLTKCLACHVILVDELGAGLRDVHSCQLWYTLGVVRLMRLSLLFRFCVMRIALNTVALQAEQ